MLVPRGAFDIYQTRSGYTAVDSEAHRQILEALAAGESQLPELCDLTGKSKPTLSTHMRELVNRELVEERDHPTDKRRKIYRLLGTRIGASDIPVPQLRRAVEAYMSLSPLQGRVRIAQVVGILLVDAPLDVLRAQGQRLGVAVAESLRVPDVRDLWMRLVQWFEEHGIAEPARVDLDAHEVALVPGSVLEAAPPAAAAVLAGLVQGVVMQLGMEGTVTGTVEGGRIVLRHA